MRAPSEPGAATVRELAAASSGGRGGYSAARTSHQLGLVAHQQRRLDQAVVAYRRAFDIYSQIDHRLASAIAPRLGVLLTELGRQAEATRVLL